MKISWSGMPLISPDSAVIRRTRTRNGALYVMSRSRHSSTEYFGSPKLCSPNSRTRLPVKSLIGEIEANASARPSVLNHSKLAICSSMRLGTSKTCGILAKLMRSRLGPESAGCSTVKAPVGIGKVLGCTVPGAPSICPAVRRDLPCAVSVPRLRRGFGWDLGAVAFAITISLSSVVYKEGSGSWPPRAHEKERRRPPRSW